MVPKKEEKEIPPHLLSSLEDLTTEVSFLAELVQMIAATAGHSGDSREEPDGR